MEQPRPPKPGPPTFLTWPKFLILSWKSLPNQNVWYFLEKTKLPSKFGRTDN